MVRKDQNGDLLNWISDTFTIDIQDRYGLIQKYVDILSLPSDVTENAFREGIIKGYDNNIRARSVAERGLYSSRIFFDIWLRCEDLPTNININDWSEKNADILMDKYYNDLWIDLSRFIKKVYTKVERSKMKLDWRFSSKKPNFEIHRQYQYQPTISGYIFCIKIYFSIDDTYDWEEEKKNSDLRVHNMMKGLFSEDSPEFKKWLEIRNKKNESFRVRKFR